jgi:hypothetical protein
MLCHRRLDFKFRNNGISQSLTDDHKDEQNHDDVVSSNNQQDMLVNENVTKVNGSNICNQGVLEEKVRITNTYCSSANINANVNPRAQRIRQSSMLMMTIQMQRMIIY